MDRKFFIAWVTLFIVWFMGSFLVHGVLLHDDYMRIAAIMRTEQDSQQYFPFMALAHVFLSGALAWIYARGVQAGKPWMAQGVRFGIAVACLTIIPTYLIYYCVQPMPGTTVVKQIVFDGILTVVLGIVVAFMYRERVAAPAAVAA